MHPGYQDVIAKRRFHISNRDINPLQPEYKLPAFNVQPPDQLKFIKHDKFNDGNEIKKTTFTPKQTN